ncbi:MAG TPA: hypothetical protein VKB93_14920 [Thermoanaerobaculia bacterium]|nr:hypothetical protein [Thermoanaerobaculia bacterium]
MLGPLFIAAVALAVFFKRRELAAFQANILGGSILPGCVIAEAVALLLLAVAMLFLASR